MMDSTPDDKHDVEIQEEFSFGSKERMASDQNPAHRGETVEAEMNGSSTGKRLGDFIPIYIPAIQKGLMTNTHHKKRFLDFLKARPANDWFLRSGFIVRRRRFRVPFVRKINWRSLVQHFKKWIRSPANVALFIWIVLCAIGIIWVGLLMLGVLDGVIKGNERRKKWEEVINQILNALFTIMCVYQHPKIFHHLVLLVRWRPKDQVEVRSIYSKKGYQRPHERRHMLFVVFLLHLTCFAQYVYCALYWGWERKERPDWATYLMLGIGTAAPILAAWYTFYGPLSKLSADAQPQDQENGSSQPTTQSDTDPTVYHNRRVVVTSPEWIGGLFDCWDDTTVAFLSCFCTTCVFGWNMERLGFGNMYVHMFTFLLLCISSLWIFGIAALNIRDDTIKIVVASAGLLSCAIGLLYGGYWRSRIRQKFRLPGNPLCCGNPLMTDFMQWLFCWPCSLAQEARTANFYDIEDDGFCRKVTDEEGRRVLVPLPREDTSKYLDSHRSLSCSPKLENIDDISPRDGSGGRSPIELSIHLGRASTFSKVHAMKPPFPPLMQTEQE